MTPEHDALVAFDLMQEFYLSRYYEPKPERPADNIQAAIEFTLDRIAAMKSLDQDLGRAVPDHASGPC